MLKWLAKSGSNRQPFSFWIIEKFLHESNCKCEDWRFICHLKFLLQIFFDCDVLTTKWEEFKYISDYGVFSINTVSINITRALIQCILVNVRSLFMMFHPIYYSVEQNKRRIAQVPNLSDRIAFRVSAPIDASTSIASLLNGVFAISIERALRKTRERQLFSCARRCIRPNKQLSPET